MTLHKFCYFCAKLRNIVDSFKFIIGILIFLAATYVYFYKTVKTQAENPPVGKKQVKAPARQPINPDFLCREPEPVLPDEGIRVTLDSPDESEPAPADSLSSLVDSDESQRIEDLRRAVIMAEVLATKF